MSCLDVAACAAKLASTVAFTTFKVVTASIGLAIQSRRRQCKVCALCFVDETMAKDWALYGQIEEDWSGFAYISDGAGKIGGTKGVREQALVLGKGDTISASTDNPEGMRRVIYLAPDLRHEASCTTVTNIKAGCTAMCVMSMFAASREVGRGAENKIEPAWHVN